MLTEHSDPLPTSSGGEALLELVAVMDRLRSPGGCPWDAEQTHQSLVEYLIEETYEAIEAIDTNDDVAMREELGDLPLQVAFHSRIGEEATNPWNIDDVARGITEKLISRHDYVFGDATIGDAAESERAWQLKKAAEKGRSSVTDGVPMAMPSLVLAAKLIRRAQRGGVEIECAPPERTAQAERAVETTANEHEFGQLLFALVAAGERHGLDADACLRKAIRDFRDQVIEVED